MLLEHQDAIAPDHNDPLHELLEDLGEAPTVETLLGKLAFRQLIESSLSFSENCWHGVITACFAGDAGVDEQGQSHKTRNQLAKTEISLTLSNKFEVPEDDKSDITSLMLRYGKKIVVHVQDNAAGPDTTVAQIRHVHRVQFWRRC